MNLPDDEGIDMSPEPRYRISEHKKAEIRNICESRFGSEFMKELGSESEHANFSTILEMLRRNEFASVDEVKGEAVRFLDAQIRWFGKPSNGVLMDQRREMVVMAENLKERFDNLVDSESSDVQSEFVIVEQLFEIFPQLDHLELHRRVNHYLNGNKMSKIDVAFAVNEISKEIFDAPDTSVM